MPDPFSALGAGVLWAVGFTKSGVAAGSLAAGMQATIGNVGAGSLFALAQSAGATGAASYFGAAVAGAGGVVGGVAGAAYNYFWT